MNLGKASRRTALALAGVVLGILAAEGALRVETPRVVEELSSRRPLSGGPGEGTRFTTDAELGYRPVFDQGDYGRWGTLRNEYDLAKPAGTHRLLFLGDSVTHRAAIQNGLEKILGDEGIEYWNAGVEGYATAQELGYYRRFLGQLEADHIVLTFHLNDFETTPVTFRDGTRIVRVYASGPAHALNPWLLEHSFLYRWWQASDLLSGEEAPSATLQQEIEGALTELHRLVEERGARLTVLVLPWLRPPAQWPGRHRKRREWILATLQRLGIEHYDFLPTLEAALAAGEPVMERERDPQHPSPEFGLRMARDLVAAGFRP